MNRGVAKKYAKAIANAIWLAFFCVAASLTGAQPQRQIEGSPLFENNVLQASLARMSPGSFNVTKSGAASYRVPIFVSPVAHGMQPNLSLSYSSQGGNGQLGVGWSLTGLPVITRCPATYAQDGISGSVAYDTNDRFCLDGLRLINISGNYGADGTEYRTERDGRREFRTPCLGHGARRKLGW